MGFIIIIISSHPDSSPRSSNGGIILPIRRPILALFTQVLRKRIVEKGSLPSLTHDSVASEVISTYDGTGCPFETVYDPFYSHRKSDISSNF